jgi:Rad52/22 family double-strand break repair protein
MGTQYGEVFAALAAPFAGYEIKQRSQSGRTFFYVTARTVMNRLDDVLGPENWTEEYVPGENSVMCKLTVTLPDGMQLSKSDAGGYAGMADQGDDDKSGFSDAFKRAAVKLGVARYLYRDGVPAFVTERFSELAIHDSAPAPASSARGESGVSSGYAPRWGNAPDPARPIAPERSQRRSAPREAGCDDDRGDGPEQSHGVPRSGKAFFKWVKDQEERYQVGLLKYLNSWAKLAEFPGRMVDWNSEQVAAGLAEATRKLQTITASSTDAYEDALAN